MRDSKSKETQRKQHRDLRCWEIASRDLQKGSSAEKAVDRLGDEGEFRKSTEESGA